MSEQALARPSGSAKNFSCVRAAVGAGAGDGRASADLVGRIDFAGERLHDEVVVDADAVHVVDALLSQLVKLGQIGWQLRWQVRGNGGGGGGGGVVAAAV